jgi:hypothetical protein
MLWLPISYIILSPLVLPSCWPSSFTLFSFVLSVWIKHAPSIREFANKVFCYNFFPHIQGLTLVPYFWQHAAQVYFQGTFSSHTKESINIPLHLWSTDFWKIKMQRWEKIVFSTMVLAQLDVQRQTNNCNNKSLCSYLYYTQKLT